MKFRFEFIKSLLGLDWKRSPPEVTWKRILENAMVASEVEKVVGQYLQAMGEEENRLLNLDGKVVCRGKTVETDNQLQILALQEAEENLTVVQTMLEKRENEISAAKRLLEHTDLENAHRQWRCDFCPEAIGSESGRKRRRVSVEIAS